jgi:hypothetical protein
MYNAKISLRPPMSPENLAKAAPAPAIGKVMEESWK